jgi:hypothetical protein
VEKFGALREKASKRAQAEILSRAAPISGEPPPTASPAAKASIRIDARWPWMTLSGVGAALVVIIAWLFSVETAHHGDASVTARAEPIAAASPTGATRDAPTPSTSAARTTAQASAKTPASSGAQAGAKAPAPTNTRASSLAAAASTGTTHARGQQPAIAATDVVKFVNPFDAREVFEFPAGTTRAEARDAVAEILLQRARDRQGLFTDRNRRRATRPSQPSRGGAGDLVENSPRPAK